MRPSVTNKPFGPTDGTRENDPMTYLTKVFVYFLQNLFRDFPEGCGMKWRPEETTTEQIITNEKPTLEVLEKTPHLVVILGSGRMSGLGMDQMQHTTFSTGARKHTDLMPMTVSYHAQAKDGLTARRIAWNAGYYTNVLRRLIMRVGRIHHISPNWDISAESAATAFTGQTANIEVISVVTTVPFYWQPQWLITEPSHLWRRLRVELQGLKGGNIYRASRENALRPPTVMGRPVNTVPIGEPEVAITQTVLETSIEAEE